MYIYQVHHSCMYEYVNVTGKEWEKGFANGLADSSILIPILSRGALNDALNDRSNVTKLTESSECDNVILEYRLGQELKLRDMIHYIYPIFMGDKNGDVYSDYFASGCHPKFKKDDHVVVDKIETKLHEHLDNIGLGSPMNDNVSVADIINAVTANQGAFVQGTLEESCNKIKVDVISMIEKLKETLEEAIIQNDAQAVSSQEPSPVTLTSNDAPPPQQQQHGPGSIWDMSIFEARKHAAMRAKTTLQYSTSDTVIKQVVGSSSEKFSSDFVYNYPSVQEQGDKFASGMNPMHKNERRKRNSIF